MLDKKNIKNTALLKPKKTKSKFITRPTSKFIDFMSKADRFNMIKLKRDK